MISFKWCHSAPKHQYTAINNSMTYEVAKNLYRAENPGLYRLVELRKAQAKATNNTAVVSDEDTQTSETTTPETKAQ